MLEEHDAKSNRIEVLKGDVEDQKRNTIKEINFYKKEYKYFYDLAHDQKSWIMMNPFMGEPIIVDKGIFLRVITKEYLKNIRINTEYDPTKFAAYVKKRQNEAYEHTQAFQIALKKEKLPELRQKIDNLNKKLNTFNVYIAKLEGCWLLTVGRSTSMINVYLDRDNFYHGILTKNKLKYYKDGSEIFVVKRQTHYTFKGYENSFTRKGAHKRNNVTIKIHKNGNFLTYISDASVKMQRCK